MKFEILPAFAGRVSLRLMSDPADPRRYTEGRTLTNGLSGRARDALGAVLARNRTRSGGFASLRLEHFLAAEGAHPAGGDPGDARASKPL